MANITFLIVLCVFLSSQRIAHAAPWVVGSGTELSCSVMLWGVQDYIWRTSQRVVNGRVVTNVASNCITGVRLARQRCGGKALNFIPTHFWKYQNKAMEPDRFCFKTNRGDDQVPVQCTDIVNWYPGNVSASGQLIDQFYRGMRFCLVEAIKQGFTKIKITPHLDDSTGGGGWRNTLALDPWTMRQGYSYLDIMLKPLCKAVRDAATSMKATQKITVMMTLQGEMNYALAAYPKSWLGVMLKVRKWVGLPPKNVKVGVSLNYNKLCGYYCTPDLKLTGSNQSFDIVNFRALLQQVDFMGISSYPSLYNGYTKGIWDFEASIMTLADELQTTFKISLTELLKINNKEFHLSEFGIGGGSSRFGNVPATNLATLADNTYFGLYGTYGRFGDPWKQPWAAKFRYEFYRNAIRWLSTKGGPNIKVDGAFIWCMSSWDVAGLYWTSYSPKGTWYNPPIMKMVAKWNNHRIRP